MKSQNKRYVFITYEDLKKIKFRKLERVCARAYVVIDSSIKDIPINLVLQTQHFGKNLKWIFVDNSTEEDVTFHITFLMGKLHEKVSKDIEFAILSNDPIFNSLVNYINHEGRSCIRVKRKKSKIEKDLSRNIEKDLSQNIDYLNGKTEPEKKSIDLDFEEVEAHIPSREYEEIITDDVVSEEPEMDIPTFSSIEKSFMEMEMGMDMPIPLVDSDKKLIEQTARETVKRLIRSGNRPSDVSLLKSYILLHNQELTIQGNIDNIIHRLEETKEINIQNQEVIYNF